MSQVSEEVLNAVKTLLLSDDVLLLPQDEIEALYKDLFFTFVEGGDGRWWWESFKDNSVSVHFKEGSDFESIPKCVPNLKEKVWFMVEDDQQPYYPIFDCSVENVIKIIGECFSYGYYLVPEDKSWLTCETYHNTLVGVGDAVIGKTE